MLVYCGNNPVVFIDPKGTEHKAVGAGLQFEITLGSCSVGFEIICYWDVDECAEGGVVIAGYVYGGFSFDMSDPLLASIIATITDNSDILIEGSEAEILAMASLIGGSCSFSISGVLVTGTDDFNRTESYEGSFTSVGVSAWKLKGSYAYSENCRAYSFGASFAVGSGFASWNVSKTSYYQVFEFSIGRSTQTVAGCAGRGGIEWRPSRSLCTTYVA